MSIACSGAKLGTGPKLFYVRILLSEGKAAGGASRGRRFEEGRKKEKRGLVSEEQKLRELSFFSYSFLLELVGTPRFLLQ